MIRNTLLLIVFVLSTLVSIQSQDIHYSQFFNSPLNLSPGLTGVFDGNLRLHANYKNQWSSVPVDYTSADIGLDAKSYIGKKGNFLSYGALLNYDKSGDLGLGWTGANLFLSISKKIKTQNYLTLGLTGGYLQRNYNLNNALTGDQWTGKGVDPSILPENIGAQDISFIDLGLGANYRWQKNYRKFIDLGVGLYHLNRPNQKFSSSTTYNVERPLKLSAYLMGNFKIGDELDLLLNGLYSKQDVYKEIVVNAQGKLYLSDSNNKILYLGAGYRFDDAWYPMIALQINQIYGAFSYDMNISDWDIATSGRGGPELSLRYILSKIPEGPYKPCLIF